MERVAPVTHTPIKLNTGNALLLALLTSMIVSSLAYQLHLSVTAHRFESVYFAKGQRIGELARLRVTPPASRGRGCETQMFTINSKLTQGWFICSLGSAPFTLTQPVALPAGRIDYSSIFTQAAPCPGSRVPNDHTVFTSPEAEYNCLLPVKISQPLAVIDNIVADDMEASASNGDVTTLTTPGVLTSTGTLRLHSSALIIAGGDITLASVQATSTTPIAVTLLSAHGNINLGSLSGSISVLGVGRHGILIPATPSSDSFPLPSFREVGLLGMRRK